MRYTLNSSRAIILLETLIALALSFLLFSWLSMNYLFLSLNHTMQLSWSMMQENFNLAMQILTNEIRLSGYLGCVKLNNLPSLRYSNLYTLSANNKVLITKDYLGQDILSVTHRSLASSILLKAMLKPDELYASTNLVFMPGDIVVISDCNHADFVAIAEIQVINHQQKIFLTKKLHTLYGVNAEIGLLELNTYTIRNDGGLYRRNIKGEVIQLVRGIKQMNFKDYYINSGQLAGVSIELHLRSGKLQHTGYGFVHVAS